MKQQVHVVPSKKVWAVKMGTRVLATYNKKPFACKAGKAFAKSIKAILVVHNRDGQFGCQK